MDQQPNRSQLLEQIAVLQQQVAGLQATLAAQQQAQADLCQHEAQWRAVAEHAPLFVAIVDRAGCIQFLNQYRPGFTAETVIGKPLYEFIDPQYHAVARESLTSVFQTGEPACYESAGSGPAGQFNEYITDVSPLIVDGQIVAATLWSRDITDRKRAEAALRDSEERFRKVFEEGPLGIALVDLQARFQHVNQRFCAMLGYTEDEIMALGIAGITHPQDGAVDRELGAQLLAGKIPSYALKKRFLH